VKIPKKKGESKNIQLSWALLEKKALKEYGNLSAVMEKRKAYNEKKKTL